MSGAVLVSEMDCLLIRFNLTEFDFLHESHRGSCPPIGISGASGNLTEVLGPPGPCRAEHGRDYRDTAMVSGFDRGKGSPPEKCLC